MSDTRTVLIVGGGFAGVACAQELAKQDVDVILLDQNNYHQFQPMLYQVATEERNLLTSSQRPNCRRDTVAGSTWNRT